MTKMSAARQQHTLGIMDARRLQADGAGLVHRPVQLNSPKQPLQQLKGKKFNYFFGGATFVGWLWANLSPSAIVGGNPWQ
jgi:hypothetical protein